jgi:hypothetical protein
MASIQDYVPVVDPTADIDPSRVPERAYALAECLFGEGWTIHQVGEWAKVLALLSRHMLKLELSERNN